MWMFNLFLVKRILKQELQVKETSGKRNRGKFYQHAHLHLLHYTLPPLPLHLLLIIIILVLILLLLVLLLLFKKVWKASRPSFLSCRHWSPPPPGSIMLTGCKLFTTYKIVTGITRLLFSDLCNPDRTWRTDIKNFKKRTKNKTEKKQKTKLKRTKKNI